MPSLNSEHSAQFTFLRIEIWRLSFHLVEKGKIGCCHEVRRLTNLALKFMTKEEARISEMIQMKIFRERQCSNCYMHALGFLYLVTILTCTRYSFRWQSCPDFGK